MSLTDKEKAEFDTYAKTKPHLYGAIEAEAGKGEPVAYYRGKESEYGYEVISLDEDLKVGTALYATPTPCPRCEERKTTAANYISLTFEFEALQTKCAELEKERDMLKAELLSLGRVR